MNKVTYIFAPIGAGKTVAVKQLEENIQDEFFWVNCDTFEKIKIENISNTYVVMDNFNAITDENKEYILNFILKNNTNRFIILSRKHIDIKLKTLYYLGDLTEINVNDINFNVTEIKAFFESENIKITDSELQQIFNDNHGHLIVINMLVEYLKKESYNRKIYQDEIYMRDGGLFIEGLKSDSLMLKNIRISQLLSFIIFIVFLCVLIFKEIKNRRKESI